MRLPPPLPRPEDRCRADAVDAADSASLLAAWLGQGLRSEAFAEDLGDEHGSSGIAQSAATRALPRAVATRVVSCFSSVMSVLPGRAPTTA